MGPSQTKYQLIVGSNHHRIFEEIMSSLKYVIEKTYPCVISIDVVLAEHHTICFDVHDYTNEFCWKILTSKSTKLIVYNLEQLGDSSPYNNIQYLDKLKLAEVWDYDRTNIVWLKSRNIIAKHVPIIYTPALVYKNIDVGNKDIDVLFYGAINTRRQSYLQHLRNNQINIHVANATAYFDTRAKLVKRSRIVLNIHFYGELARLEMSRIAPLLANEVFVISEPGSDLIENDEYSKCLVFIKSPDELVQKVKHYLTHPNEMSEIAKRGFTIFSSKELTLPL